MGKEYLKQEYAMYQGKRIPEVPLLVVIQANLYIQINYTYQELKTPD